MIIEYSRMERKELPTRVKEKVRDFEEVMVLGVYGQELAVNG